MTETRAVTHTVRVNAIDGTIRVDLPDDDDTAAWDDLAAPEGGVFNGTTIEPWGVDEESMDRADAALAEFGFERVGPWSDDDECPTATIRRKSSTDMSSTIYAADAVDLFAGEFAGIRLIEDEFGRFIAYGHVSEADLLAGVAAYCEEYGGDLHGATADGLPVEHVWAVLKHEDDEADDEGWSFSWSGITERMPKAFPLTVVPR